MGKNKILKGFSKLSPQEKLLLASERFEDPASTAKQFESFQHPDEETQEILSGISENTISNYPLPYNVAPNFLINGKLFMVPMVTEESSVVAAASSAARFWVEKGGFHARVAQNIKNGQLHFLYGGAADKLKAAMPDIESSLRAEAKPVTKNMEQRGGGIRTITLNDRRHLIDGYFQLHVRFDTIDAMGANFINSCLEVFASALGSFFDNTDGFDRNDYEPLMAILSNYNDQCLVEVSVSCDVDALGHAAPQLSAEAFVRRFILALKVAESDIYRATTHNKGIMNGVDAVILATGNDFRAIETGAHAWAARSGQYRSLSQADVQDNRFSFSLQMPMALGTVGGLTRLHPLAARSLEMLGNPDAKALMMVAGAAGLANNFAAIRSLTTTGIQSGHMRMHLSNIIMQLNTTKEEARYIKKHFAEEKISYQAVAQFLEVIRKRGT